MRELRNMTASHCITCSKIDSDNVTVGESSMQIAELYEMRPRPRALKNIQSTASARSSKAAATDGVLLCYIYTTDAHLNNP